MKKIILLSAIIISTLISCSPEDISTYEQNSEKKIMMKENASDFCITCRDTISRDNDSINGSGNPRPIKP